MCMDSGSNAGASATGPAPRVAVVGTGMAGLACAWQLAQGGAEVTVYDKQEIPGLGAHSVRVDGVVVDMPPRIFVEDYYVNLLALYRHINVRMGPADIAQTYWFQDSGSTFFRYFLCKVGVFALPLALSPSHLLTRKFWRIVRTIYYFSRDLKRDYASGALNGITLDAYFAMHKYPVDFTDHFFLPMFSVVCTCTVPTLRGYPVKTIAEFMFAQPFLHSHKSFRAYGDGCQEVARMLLAGATAVRCGVTVTSITNHDDTGAPVVTLSDGTKDAYDHVVVATQANQALRMLPTASPAETAHLSAISYEQSDIALHRDANLMPPVRRSLWSPMNIMVPTDAGATGMRTAGMCTAWQNAIQPPLACKDDLFQSWNPLVAIAEDKLVHRVTMERSVVSLESERMLETLPLIQGVRRIWFCGSYAKRGIPLLESACASGLEVAEAITSKKRSFGKLERDRRHSSGGVPWSTVSMVGAAALAVGFVIRKRLDL